MTPSKAAIAAGRTGTTEEQKKKASEVSVTYATSAASYSVSASFDLAELTETSFGMQLMSLLRLHSKARYVP